MSKVVLLVEDDAFLRETLRLTLQEQGVTVEEAANGEEAIQTIDRRQPHLVLLDLLMPKSDGYAVLSHIKEKAYTFPVIILSNLSDYLDHEKCEKLGAKDYFIKSDMDEDELWPKIQRYL
ncbi:MAG: response regulator [Candidatus Peribacteraceae bacterium]|nr:response regulator [Candidatus Peribacteraceae bacterium]